MLPLPLIAEDSAGETVSQKRRRARLRLCTRLANGALSALNSLLGFYHSQAGEPLCALHSTLRAETLDRASCFVECPNAEVVSDESALNQLLRGQSVYSVDKAGCAVKPYGSGPVSLPSSVEGCQLLEDMLESDDLLYLQGDHERMRNHNPQLDASIPIPYFDVVLKRNRRSYLKFVKQLLRLNLVSVTDTVRAEVG